MTEESCESKVANLLAMIDEVECPETKIDLFSEAVKELQKEIEALKEKVWVLATLESDGKEKKRA